METDEAIKLALKLSGTAAVCLSPGDPRGQGTLRPLIQNDLRQSGPSYGEREGDVADALSYWRVPATRSSISSWTAGFRKLVAKYRRIAPPGARRLTEANKKADARRSRLTSPPWRAD